MSLTYAAQQTDNPARKTGAIVFVVLLHLGFLYAFTHGLTMVKLVAPLKDTVAVLIPDDTPPETPPTPEIKPPEMPVDNLVQDVPPPVEVAVTPDVPVAVPTDMSAISAGSIADAAPARSFSIKHQVNPVYPPASRRAGEAGTVLLNIVIGPNGVPADITVEHSSGYPALDDAAVKAVRQWRFTVSSDSQYSRVHLPVTFKLSS